MALLRNLILRRLAPSGAAVGAGLWLALTASLFVHDAGAQTVPPPAAEAPSERAKRDAEKVYQMILMHADKPRKATPVPAPVQRLAKPTGAAEADARKGLALPSASNPSSAAGGASALLGEDNPARSPPAPPPLAAEAAPAAVMPGSDAAPLPGAARLKPETAKPVLELVSSVVPEFPKALVRRLGIGSVVVGFEVLPDGRVGTTTIVKTSHPGLNGPAQEAVGAWRFKPISEPVEGVTELRFE